VYIRGGSIIPMRANSAYTTTALRLEDFELIIAPDADGRASGDLYLDDGDSLEVTESSLLHFTYEEGVLEMDGEFGYEPGVEISGIKLLGATNSTCQGHDATAKTLIQSVSLPLTQKFKVKVEQC
jgi:alpha-glucosidase